MTTLPIITPKKLIEVALPLDDINKACAREKSIRHGHPSTLHLWWARRPLAAARAVIFAQMVNDPSWKYSDEELKKPQVKSAITRKRKELFALITKLVQWENTNNSELLSRAQAAIQESWRETCEANKHHVDAEIKRLFDPEKVPAFHDPFAGGGAIPLEAQRLGLESHASDLNPVAVLINKAMIEMPPAFAGRPPVGPLPRTAKQTNAKVTEDWSGAKGLAEDIRRYGLWAREEAFRRVGNLYPLVTITKPIIKERPDLARYEGRQLTVIALIWARTVRSPNPAANGASTALISSFLLAQKHGKEAWAELKRERDNSLRFVIRVGQLTDATREELKCGTRAGKAQDFLCVHTGTPVARDYVRDEGKAGRLGEVLMAVVLEGDRERVYLAPEHAPMPEPSSQQCRAATEARKSFLSGATPTRAMITGGVCSAYGLTSWGSLFTDRQLTFLLAMSELVNEVKEMATRDTLESSKSAPSIFSTQDYGEAIATYLAFVMSRSIDRGSSLCSWDSSPKMEALRNTFGRQALPMVWDFAEGNPFSESSGCWQNNVDWVASAVERLPASVPGTAYQADAQTLGLDAVVVSADPPYYDNIGYAELSDFFYPWIRRSLPWARKGLLATLLTPKAEELVVSSHRHGGKKEAEEHFLNGMTQALSSIARGAHPAIPVTVYYAFKQAESKANAGTVSTGWETFLDACMRAGFAVTGTWPMRTELGNRLVGVGTNALASSIVLVFRARSVSRRAVARKEFLRELGRSLPRALFEMTADATASVAPVDLAQAAIGPGMAVFSQFESVLEADGTTMSVHEALLHINKAIDDHFAEAEGEMDADTRFCISWFQQYGFETGPFGEADVLARAKGTSVDGVRDAGVLSSAKGKVRLLKLKEYPIDWDPTADDRTPIWEACHQMSRALGESEHDAGILLARMPDKQDAIRQLAYRLYTLCERKGWADFARSYNELVASWPAIVEESHKSGHKGTQLDFL